MLVWHVPSGWHVMVVLDKSHGNIHFHIWVEGRRRSGQIGSEFETQQFLPKTNLSCQGLSQDSNNVLILTYLRQKQTPELRFEKATPYIALLVFAKSQQTMYSFSRHFVYLLLVHSFITHFLFL